MRRPSVNDGRLLARHVEGRQIRLDTQSVKDGHDGAFAGCLEGLPRDFSGRFQGDANSLDWAFHFFTLLAGQFCRFLLRGAIGTCRYGKTTLCNSQQQLNTFGA